MKTDWEYEQAVLDKLRLRRRKQRRARLTAGALAGVLAVVLSVGAAAVTIREGRLPLETPLGPGNTSVQDSAALAAIREQLWEYAAAQSDALLFEKETTPDDLTVEVLGELNGYTFVRSVYRSGEPYTTGIGGYLFTGSASNWPYGPGLYLLTSGQVLTLSEAYELGVVDMAQAARLAGGQVKAAPGEEEALQRLTAYMQNNAQVQAAPEELSRSAVSYGTVGSYRVCSYTGSGDTAVWESTYQGYTFHSGAIYYPSPLGVYLVCSDDLYDGGVITLEDACAYGIADAAQIYAVLPESYQAGTPDTRTGVAQLEDQALRQALEQLFRQEGCTLPADAAVREYGDILFVDTGVQDIGKYWAYGEQYGRALRCLVSGQPSAVGLYYCGGTEAPITIEDALRQQILFMPELYAVLPETMFVPVSYNPDHTITETQLAALNTMVQYLAGQGVSEEIPAPGSAVSTGIKAYDSINGCVVVKVDTVKNGIAVETAVDGVVFRSEDTHAPYALGLYLVRGQEVLTLEEAVEAGWATAKEVQFAVPSDVGGTAPTIGPQGTPPAAGSSTATTDGLP